MRKEQTHFHIYVSGDYEIAYFKSIHTNILRTQYGVNLHTHNYEGGNDFQDGIKKLRNDLNHQARLKELKRADLIFIQGDYDRKEAISNIEQYANEIKMLSQKYFKTESKIALAKSIHSFESWIYAHYRELYDQEKNVNKPEIDQFIPKYSISVEHAKKGFDTLSFEHLRHASHKHYGNQSFREFIQNLNIKLDE